MTISSARRRRRQLALGSMGAAPNPGPISSGARPAPARSFGRPGSACAGGRPLQSALAISPLRAPPLSLVQHARRTLSSAMNGIALAPLAYLLQPKEWRQQSCRRPAEPRVNATKRAKALHSSIFSHCVCAAAAARQNWRRAKCWPPPKTAARSQAKPPASSLDECVFVPRAARDSAS
jgi:hypothetical protein